MNFKKNFKKITALAAVMAMALSMAACGADNAADNTDTAAESTSAAENAAETAEILNFIPPEKGEKIAVMTVKDYGEIKIKLFPEAASKGVENFIGLADMNYYDELIFHRVIPHFMDQGGDPQGTGMGGQSMWGGSFDGGIPEGLYHFSGAIAYANSGSTSPNGSQFYIVNTDDGECVSDVSSYPQNVQDMYKEKGGVPYLDGGYTVFGQVFDGMDVVRKIGQVETDDNDKPLTQVQIETVRIVEYTGE